MIKTSIFKVTVLLLIINMVLFNGASPEKMPHFEITPAQEGNFNTVIFDVGDVLFSVSRSAKRNIFLTLFWENPTLIPNLVHKACLTDIKKDLFTMLDHVSAHSTEKMYNQGEKIPQIMVDWMNGRSSQDLIKAIDLHLECGSYSETDKVCFRKITRFMFEAEQLTGAMEPIKPMIQLAQALKAKGYKLYVLSNWDHESFEIMRTKHSAVFDLFDGIMISGKEKMGKPHKHFYNKLMNRYNLRPEECIFIDDEQYNTKAAEQLGIRSVWKRSVNSVLTQLQELRVIKQTSTCHNTETAVHLARLQRIRNSNKQSNG